MNIGDIVRYDGGCTALMRISYISKNHGGPGQDRYYGQQCMGGTCGAYASYCKPASPEDHKMWEDVRKVYKHITPWETFNKSSAVVGAVED